MNIKNKFNKAVFNINSSKLITFGSNPFTRKYSKYIDLNRFNNDDERQREYKFNFYLTMTTDGSTIRGDKKR